MYGNTFDRGGWVLSFIKQNHHTALINLPPSVPTGCTAADPVPVPASPTTRSNLTHHSPTSKINLPIPSPAARANHRSPVSASNPNISEDLLPPPPPIIRAKSSSPEIISSRSDLNPCSQLDEDDLLPPPAPSISLLPSFRCRSPPSPLHDSRRHLTYSPFSISNPRRYNSTHKSLDNSPFRNLSPPSSRSPRHKSNPFPSPSPPYSSHIPKGSDHASFTRHSTFCNYL